MSHLYQTEFDGNFVAGDSPTVIAFRDDRVDYVKIENCGAGDMSVQFSIDGAVSYGDALRIFAGKNFESHNIQPSHVKITHIADTSYQVYAEGD